MSTRPRWTGRRPSCHDWVVPTTRPWSTHPSVPPATDHGTLPWGRGTTTGGGTTTAFFAPRDIHLHMDSISDALASLPEAVFADVLESEDSYLLVFDVPGVTEDTVAVAVSGNRLTVEARREKAVPDGFWFRDERRDLFLDADVPLPPDAVGSEATARLESGVLEVTIPKASGTVTQVPVEG